MPISRKPSCPSGHVLRESYHSKSGKTVKARCIRKTGVFRGKASEKADMMRSKATSRAKMASRMSHKAGLRVPSRCPKGMTLRAGYTRRSYNRKAGTHVRHALTAPGCIKTRGKKSGSKARVIMFDKADHLLSQHGYHHVEEKTAEERHTALHKVIADLEKEHSKMAAWNYVIKALNARYIVNRNTNRKVARIMKADQRDISKEYKQVNAQVKAQVKAQDKTKNIKLHKFIFQTQFLY
jgi:hypothetical protein